MLLEVVAYLFGDLFHLLVGGAQVNVARSTAAHAFVRITKRGSPSQASTFY